MDNPERAYRFVGRLQGIESALKAVISETQPENICEMHLLSIALDATKRAVMEAWGKAPAFPEGKTVSQEKP